MPETADRAYWERRAGAAGSAADGYASPTLEAIELGLRRAAFGRLCAVEPGQRVLDAGCGRGRWTAQMAAAGCEVVGVDVSGRMIELAARVAGARYVVGSLADIDEATAGFDLVLTITVLQHITDEEELARALSNLRRLLKPEGRVFFLEYSRPRWLFALRSPKYMRYRTEKQWLELLAQAGLEPEAGVGVRCLWPLYGLGALAARTRRSRPRTGQGAGAATVIRTALRIEHWLSRLPFQGALSDERALILRPTGHLPGPGRGAD